MEVEVVCVWAASRRFPVRSRVIVFLAFLSLVLAACGVHGSFEKEGPEAIRDTTTMFASSTTSSTADTATTTAASSTTASTADTATTTAASTTATTTTSLAAEPSEVPLLGYVIIGGDWGSSNAGRWGNSLVALGTDGATWLGDLPVSFRHIEGDLTGGVVYQSVDDWSIYRVRPGDSAPEQIVNLLGGDVRWTDFEVVERLGSPAILYTVETVLSGGEIPCDEACDESECGDCGLFLGDVRRVARLQSLDSSDAIDVLDTVIHYDNQPGGQVSVIDYAAGLFEIVRISESGCQSVEFWDEAGRRSESIPPSHFHDGECDGVPVMTFEGDLSQDGTLILRHESVVDRGTDLVVRELLNGTELHRLPVWQRQNEKVHRLGYSFDGTNTITMLYADDFAVKAEVFELVLTYFAPEGDATMISYDLPAEAQMRLRAVRGGCCLVTFIQNLDVNLTGLRLAD
jgi:hypothetical protein